MPGRFRIIGAGGAALVLLLLAHGAPASARTKAAPPKTAPTAPAAPAYVPQAPIVMLKDLDSGAILYARGADQRFAPASMAKVMTAYVVLDLIKAGKLSRDTQFTVGEAEWKKWRAGNGGSSMFLSPGEKVSVDELRAFVTAKAGMTQGWTGSFDKLEAYLEKALTV